jgi:uncharacterized membrane protein YkvI
LFLCPSILLLGPSNFPNYPHVISECTFRTPIISDLMFQNLVFFFRNNKQLQQGGITTSNSWWKELVLFASNMGFYRFAASGRKMCASLFQEAKWKRANSGYFDFDILAAFDTAVTDNVDVISISDCRIRS